MTFSCKRNTALAASHLLCLLIGWGTFAWKREKAAPSQSGLKRAASPPIAPTPGKNTSDPATIPTGASNQESLQPALSYDGGSRVSMDFNKLSLSLQPILSDFNSDPRFLDLLGATSTQKQQIQEILETARLKQNELESTTFKLLDQQGGKATFVVENSPAAARESRLLLEKNIAAVLGSNSSKLFIKSAETFLDNNALFTDNVIVFNTEDLPPEIARMAGASRSINIFTLSRGFIPPDSTIDADFIKRARDNNFLSGGSGYSINKDIPARMRHLIE